MVTPIYPRRMVATSPQGGLARPPTGWVGGRACSGFGSRGWRALQFPNHRRLPFPNTFPSVSSLPGSPPSPYNLPNPDARGFLIPEAWLALGLGEWRPRGSTAFLLSSYIRPTAGSPLVSSAVCSEVSPSQLPASFSWLPDLT